MMESNDDQQNQDDDQQVVTSQIPLAKSYDCTYCRRGFSNAQALGGHMNIHRKDKAKLKQVSSSSSPNIVDTNLQQQRLPLEFPKMPIEKASHIIPHDHIERKGKITRGSSWPADWFLDKEGSHDHSQLNPSSLQVQQHPLFSQASLNQDHHDQGGQKQQVEDHGDQSESGEDLDLELRLWHEPQDSGKATTTRKFF